MSDLKVLSGCASTRFTSSVCKEMGISMAETTVKCFQDSETYVKINEKIRGEDVFIVQSTSNPVNQNLMELLIMIDAAKRASAGRINVVMPYFGYARQDRKASSREPITAKLVANLLTVAGAQRLVTVDLHADQVQGFFDIPVDHFVGYPLFADYFKRKDIKDLVVVSPDTGFAKKARKFAKLLDIPLAIIDKRRPAHEQVEVMNVIGDVRGKNCILLDDLIDTAGTITEGARALKDNGAQDVYICATHAVLSGSAIDRLNNSGAKEIIFTDTIEQSGKIKNQVVLSIVPLMARVIQRIHENKSLGELFIWEKVEGGR